MKMIPVESSNLESVGYWKGTLWITFHSGSTYRYYRVPEFVFEALLEADSKGRFFYLFIRDQYLYEQVNS